jgi:hypothetical protein
MDTNAPALGVLFDVSKIETGGYGIESWKIFWRAIDMKDLFVKKLLLFEGDLASDDTIYCIGIQALDQDVLNKIKRIMEKNDDYNKVAANPSFLEGPMLYKEQLPSAGILEWPGKLSPSGYNSKAAFDEVNKT